MMLDNGCLTIIVVLVSIIIILLFSRISIDFGGKPQPRKDLNSNNNNRNSANNNDNNRTKSVSDEKPSMRKVSSQAAFDPRESELLSDEFKEQLDELENRFYYNN